MPNKILFPLDCLTSEITLSGWHKRRFFAKQAISCICLCGPTANLITAHWRTEMTEPTQRASIKGPQQSKILLTILNHKKNHRGRKKKKSRKKREAQSHSWSNIKSEKYDTTTHVFIRVQEVQKIPPWSLLTRLQPVNRFYIHFLLIFYFFTH